MSQKTPLNYLLPSALLFVGLGAGYYLGAHNTASSSQAVGMPSTSEHPVLVSNTDSHESIKSAQITKTSSSSTSSREKNEDYSSEGTMLAPKFDNTMAEEIDQLLHLSNADGELDYSTLNKSKQQLLTLAKKDPSALKDLLSAYSENLNNDMVQDQLFQVISQIKTPEVEALGTELASSSDRKESIAGFDLLGALNIPTKETLELTTSTLRNSPEDKELVLSAMHALPKLPLSSEKNSEVVELLSDLAHSDNEAIRSESLLSIASWAKSEDELKSVISALDSNTPDDKISAAMALEQSNVTGPQLKSVLLEKISSSDELWEVRAMSANALKRFDLSESEFATLQAFRKEQVGGVEH